LMLFFGLYMTFTGETNLNQSKNWNGANLSINISSDNLRDQHDVSSFELHTNDVFNKEMEDLNQVISNIEIEKEKGKYVYDVSETKYIDNKKRDDIRNEKIDIKNKTKSLNRHKPIFDLRKESRGIGVLPKLLKGSVTDYPEFEYIQQIEGIVILKMAVNERGFVDTWEVMEGDLNQGFVNTSIDMVKTWQFEPYLVEVQDSEFEPSSFILIKIFHYKL